MAHFKIKVADLLVDVVAKGELTARICEPYLVDSAFTDISIYATPAQIKKKIASMPIPLTEEEAECICLHENLALKLVYHDAFVLHAALLSYKGEGYAIVAPRGVGKTVHANMWLSRFGKDAAVINGDKPILRRQGALGHNVDKKVCDFDLEMCHILFSFRKNIQDILYHTCF